MAESTLTATRDDVLRELAIMLGMRRDFAQNEPDDQEDLEAMLKRGQRKFYWPFDPATARAHKWGFLYPIHELSFKDVFNDGTVEIASGVVTLTGATFPSFGIAEADIEVNDNLHTVASRDSPTQLTLLDTSVTEAAGSEYSLQFNRYRLPDDFGSLDGTITYRADTGTKSIEVTHVEESIIRHAREVSDFTGRPYWVTIHPKKIDPSIGQRWLMEVYPTPDDDYRVRFPYMRNPDAITSTNLYHWGGAFASEALVQACLLAAEETFVGINPARKQAFDAALAQAISHDKQSNTPGWVGSMNEGQYPLPPVQRMHCDIVGTEDL